MTGTGIRLLLLAAAAASLVLMYRAGHRNPSIVLMLMFTVWVSSPFVALDVVNSFARRWPSARQAVIRTTAVIVALGSVSVYGVDAVRPLSSKGAFFYLVVPFVSWLVIAGAMAVARARK